MFDGSKEGMKICGSESKVFVLLCPGYQKFRKLSIDDR
jgi:hypothetical protein